MEYKDERKEQIKALQENLTTIRKIAGWTMDELGDLIGVTKQTISNLENQKSEMTLTQYIAIRAVLDYEIQTNKTNEVLPEIVALLLDKRGDYSETERSKIEDAAKSIAAVAASGIAGASLAAASTGLLSSFVGGAIGGVLGGPIGVIAGTVWLSKVVKLKKSKGGK